VRLETLRVEILESIKGQDMIVLVGGVIGDMLGAKVLVASSDLGKMKGISKVHGRREAAIATYLDKLAGDRPAEGLMIMKSLESVDAQIVCLTGELSRQYAGSREQIALLRVQGQQGASLAGDTSPAERAECEGIRLQYSVLAVAVGELEGDRSFENVLMRVGTVEDAMRPAVANRLPQGAAVACGPCGQGRPAPGGSLAGSSDNPQAFLI
jgi:hypothetical protein